MNNIFKFVGISKFNEHKKLMSNTFSLYIIQAVNYLLPLIMIPYLIRVLGTETFGFIAFASSLTAYFQIIIDYGFNLSATREVSLHKRDVHWLSRQFFSVLFIKAALVLVCAIVFIVILYGIPRFNNEAALCIWLYIGIAGSILFPIWLFQGMEEMGYITFFNLLTKLLMTILYFLLIKGPNDYMWFAYLGAIGSWVINGVSFFVALKKFNLKLVFPEINFCIACLKEGFQIFITQVSVSLFTNTNTFLLGIFTNNQVVGKYAVAEKIVRAVIFLSAPVGSAIYPRISILFSESRILALRFLKKVFVVGTVIFGLISIALFVLADYFVLLVSGQRSNDIALLVRIMSVLPLSVFIDNIFGTQIMLNIGMKKQLMWIILIGGIISVLLQVTLVPHIKAMGSAIGFLGSEIAILVLMICTVRMAGIRLMK
jgi:polysaccharide transporter, PST family